MVLEMAKFQVGVDYLRHTVLRSTCPLAAYPMPAKGAGRSPTDGHFGSYENNSVPDPPNLCLWSAGGYHERGCCLAE